MKHAFLFATLALSAPVAHASEADLYACLEAAIYSDVADRSGVSYEDAEYVLSDNVDMNLHIDQLARSISIAARAGVSQQAINEGLHDRLSVALAFDISECVSDFYRAYDGKKP